MAKPTSEEQAPFNMALKTLEAVRLMIDKIADTSIGITANGFIPQNQMIAIKYRQVKQLIVTATPLLTKQELIDALEKYNKIKLAKGRIKQQEVFITTVVFTKEVDDDLDDCVIKIEQDLQDSGHFMPSADESGLF